MGWGGEGYQRSVNSLEPGVSDRQGSETEFKGSVKQDMEKITSISQLVTEN